MGLEVYRESFERAQLRILAALWFQPPWVCQCGLWPSTSTASAFVLKVRQAHWSTDPKEEISSTNGLFFSVWADESSATSLRLRYNLHALKLRSLPGYRLESRKFATAFRLAFAEQAQAWPNARIDFGPQTLFEGFRVAPADQWETTIVDLVTAFQPLAGVVESLLAERREPADQ